MIQPPRWSTEQLAADAAGARQIFRQQRLEEPLEAYLRAFDVYQGRIAELFEKTVDLTRLDADALQVLTDPGLLEALRYLTGPPISADDLKTTAEAASLVAARLRNDSVTVEKIIQVVRAGLDRRRFPWVAENREPDETERRAAVMASAVLLATQRVGTTRRTAGKRTLEGLLEVALTTSGLVKLPTRAVRTFSDAPPPGSFSGESMLGNRKADFIVRLWDQRLMPLECKASNSAINSVKRLNNDAAAKAKAWSEDFGTTQVVPAAVLSGVFKVHNLADAQNRGLSLFWGHNLAALTDWIEQTRSAQ